MKATAEAEERKKIQRSACFEGRRLLAVRAADKDGFWYTENLAGFGGGEALSLDSMAGAMLLVVAWVRVRVQVLRETSNMLVPTERN